MRSIKFSSQPIYFAAPFRGKLKSITHSSRGGKKVKSFEQEALKLEGKGKVKHSSLSYLKPKTCKYQKKVNPQHESMWT